MLNADLKEAYIVLYLQNLHKFRGAVIIIQAKNKPICHVRIFICLDILIVFTYLITFVLVSPMLNYQHLTTTVQI